MGIGIFAVWPLAKKLGKRNITALGFILFSIGSAICYIAPTNMPIVLIGQFIKNIGGLPSAYVFMALFADDLDHLEWKSGIRCDGTAMSIYNILAVSLAGIATGIFNFALFKTGYIEPQLQPDGTTIGFPQPQSCQNWITFAFVGLEAITGILLAGILIFLSVEKNLEKKQAIIRERQKAACLAAGKEWVEPEEAARIADEAFAKENEEAFLAKLKVTCEKKGLSFEEEKAKHEEQVALKNKKAEEKRIASEKKAALKLEKKEKAKAEKEAKLTPEQKEQKAIALKAKEEKAEAAWEKEKAQGEAFEKKIEVVLAEAMKNYERKQAIKAQKKAQKGKKA